jgi:hypothetical protein
MSQPNQERTARRFESFHTETTPLGYDADYECELPADAKAELGRIPPRPDPAPPGRGDILLLVGAVALAAVILVGVIANYSRQRNQSPVSPTPDLVLEHSRALLAQPALGWHSDGSAYGRADMLPEVRRAERVSPAPRAERVSPAPRAEQVLRIGRWNQVWMPDGALTGIQFWGVKDTFADLPRSPQPGDSYGVLEGGQHALWVWYALPGHAAPAWVDP